MQLNFQLFDFFLVFLNFLWANVVILFYQSETILAIQFFLNFNYSFLFLVWYCLLSQIAWRNNLPPWAKIIKTGFLN